eukprot:10896960-Heterocapsa_arctica.AAC.1
MFAKEEVWCRRGPHVDSNDPSAMSILESLFQGPEEEREKVGSSTSATWLHRGQEERRGYSGATGNVNQAESTKACTCEGLLRWHQCLCER